jgi:hypothetical protein
MLALATGDWIRRVRLHDVRDRQSGKAAAPGRTTLWELTPAQGRAVAVAFAAWCAGRAKRAAGQANGYAAADAAVYAADAAADARTADAEAAVADDATYLCAVSAHAAATSAADAGAYAACESELARAAARDVERKAQSRKLTAMLYAAHRAATRGEG